GAAPAAARADHTRRLLLRRCAPSHTYGPCHFGAAPSSCTRAAHADGGNLVLPPTTPGRAPPARTALVGETRSPRRVSPHVEEGPSAECPIVPGSTRPSKRS